MLAVSAEFLAESMRDGHEPLLYMDIWPDKGPQRKLTNSSDWSGVIDPAVVLDSGVSATRKTGALLLDTGAASVLPPLGTLVPITAHSMAYQINVYAITHVGGNNFSGHYTVLDGYTSSVIQQDPSLTIPFISGSTFLMDSMGLSVQNTGNGASNLTLRITDATGNQLGNQVTVPVGASTAVLTRGVGGLNVSLRKGGSYLLVLGYTFPHAPGAGLGTTVYTVNMSVSSVAIGAYTHSIVVDAPNGFPIGGFEGYQATGTATRTLDVLSVPVGDGLVTFSDIVPGGADPTNMTITMYYADSAAVAIEPTMTNWTLHGVVSSGDILPPHQYWRAVVAMASNALNDETPELNDLTVTYIGDPQTFGHHMETAPIDGIPDQHQIRVRPGLESVSTATAQLTPKPSASMVGRVSVTLLPEDAINALMQKKLRGRPVRIRAGYTGLSETIEFYSGIVRDMAWSRGKYTLTLNDTIALADVQVPRTKAGLAWSSTKDYAIGDTVIYGTNSWNALLVSGPAHGGAVTPVAGTVWQDNGTVWLDIGYTATTNGNVEWHLADIAKDLIINRINIQSQNVDFDSLAAAKLRWPQRTGSRTLNKPVKAFEMLSELAWLLEAQWAVRGGKLTLIAEPGIANLPQEFISPDDVAAGHSYRRGWAELKNESLIITGYSGAGNSNAQYSDGVAVADATSIAEYGMVGLDVFHDKWNVPSLELGNVSSNFVNRWKDGRRVIPSTKNQMRLLRMEPGDVVMFDSLDLPPGDAGPYKVMILKKDMRWAQQSLSMSFIEVN